MQTDSIHEAQENVAKMQDALDNAQRLLAAAERAQEAAEQAHERAEQHAVLLRTVSFVAIGVIVLAVVASFRRRRR
jgi:hypothetical protein